MYFGPMEMDSSIPSWEPHGKALRAYWQGDEAAVSGIQMEEEAPVWMPAAIYFRDEDEFPGVEVYALELCEGRVLDVGAGAGAHCLALQTAGFEVTGLDISPDAVAIMQERGVKNAISGDFLDLAPEEPYDTLLFLMNGIGVAGTLEGLRAFLHHASSLTEPNGQILLDSADLRETGMAGATDGSYFGQIPYRLLFEDLTGDAYHWLYVDAETLTQIADECGWFCQVVYEAGEGSYLARLVKSEGFLLENG